LLDDDDERAIMGKAGRTRVEREMGWSYQRDLYVAVYDSLVGKRQARG
jgi:hypothetical protein